MRMAVAIRVRIFYAIIPDANAYFRICNGVA